MPPNRSPDLRALASQLRLAAAALDRRLDNLDAAEDGLRLREIAIQEKEAALALRERVAINAERTTRPVSEGPKDAERDNSPKTGLTAQDSRKRKLGRSPGSERAEAKKQRMSSGLGAATEARQADLAVRARSSRNPLTQNLGAARLASAKAIVEVDEDAWDAWAQVSGVRTAEEWHAFWEANMGPGDPAHDGSKYSDEYGEQRAAFSSDDADLLLREAKDIAKVREKYRTVAWEAWTEQHPDHTAEEWREFWEKHVEPGSEENM
ncbi:hypothetical protein LTR85_009009 [Meristemomyces frigidus]|nr:hypothetical protein LTR85_009009 [Meristemomyces frigidus]